MTEIYALYMLYVLFFLFLFFSLSLNDLSRGIDTAYAEGYGQGQNDPSEEDCKRGYDDAARHLEFVQSHRDEQHGQENPHGLGNEPREEESPVHGRDEDCP